MPDLHVVPQGDRWGVVEAGGEVRSTHRTQDEAITEGRLVAEHEQTELVIHRKDGKIREKDSHGNDPRDVAG